MKRTPKHFLSVFLAAVLILVSAFPAFANEHDIDKELLWEGEYAYQLDETGEAPVISFLAYEGESADAYIPKTIAGIPLTPDNFDATVFLFGRWPGTVRVDDDNEYFTVIDGGLYSKDGKRLIAYPSAYTRRAVVTLPEGVEIIGWASLRYVNCIVIPATVTTIEDYRDYWYLGVGAIAGMPGTVAETYARENEIDFVSMAEDHTHVYFHGTIQEPTCLDAAVYELACPCGESRIYDGDMGDHSFEWVYDEIAGYWVPTACEYCGRTWEEVFGEPYDHPDHPIYNDDCDCVCHKFIDSLPDGSGASAVVTLIRDFFWRLRIVLWRLTGTNQYCACGARHY